ncbi:MULTISPECIES: Uma2 family endonuclease [unclassified Microcoleus]|uniref:Uma2 family endonuclease n=1 Tax=unclassified Microcoleus TaxID=2642155 RepID=UPI002FD337D2
MLLLDPKTLAPATEQRIILYDVTWEQYEQLSDMFVDEFPRMIYLEGTLEIIMTTSPEHERLKKIIARLIETYAVERLINLNGYGNATFRREAVRRGAEPDECYCLGTLAEIPDIAIEIALTSGGVDKLEVYRGLQVPEVWFWANDQFSIYHLRESGYELISSSEFFPELDFSVLSQYVGYVNQTEAVIAYRTVLQTATRMSNQ